MTVKKFLTGLLLLVGLGWVTATAVSSTDSPKTIGGLTPPTLTAALIADGFSEPTDIASAGDDRLFIVEREGTIRIIDRDGEVIDTPFLDINGRVDSLSHREMGLLGLAFHPNYPETPFFYVNYTNNDGNTQISRFTLTSERDSADPDSEQVLLEIDQPFRNHNGGDLNFGADGYLYIAVGDGGSANDPNNYAQRTDTLLGKILRIDVDDGTPYAIPPDNPFVSDPDARDEIWVLGLRNPWRFSFDRETGGMYIGDVGQGEREEVNFAPASSNGGENYGWRCYEGFQAHITTGCGDESDYAQPIDDYPHSSPSDDNNEGRSVTGGFVYRGAIYEDLQGYYLYADFVTANVWLAMQDGASWQIVANGPITDVDNISTFGEGCDGELYIADFDGEIYQIQTGFVPTTPIAGPFFLYLPQILQGDLPPLACDG